MFSTKSIWIVPVAVLVFSGEAHAFGANHAGGTSVPSKRISRHGPSSSFPHPVFLCSAADIQKEEFGNSLRSFFKNNSQKAFKLTTRGHSNMANSENEEAPSKSTYIRLSKRQKVSDFVKSKVIKAPLAFLARLKERRLSNNTVDESDDESVNGAAPEFWKGTSTDVNGSTNNAPRQDMPSVQDSMKIIASASKKAEGEKNAQTVEVRKERNSVAAKLPSDMLGDAGESREAIAEVTIKEAPSLQKDVVSSYIEEEGSSDDAHAEEETPVSAVVTQGKEATVDVASATLQKTKSLNNAYRERIKSKLQPEVQSRVLPTSHDSGSDNDNGNSFVAASRNRDVASRAAEIEKARQQPKTPSEEARLSAKYGAMTPEDRAFNIVLDLGMVADHSCSTGDDDDYCDENVIPDDFTLHLS